MDTLSAVITVSAILVGLFLVLKYSEGFQSAFGSAGSQFIQAITALQGPTRG